VWLDFSQDTVDTLMRCGNAAETRNVLCDRLHLERGTDKSEILLDAFQGCLAYSKERKFTSDKISVMLGILNRVHNFACQTSFENSKETVQVLRDLILSHAYLRPPFAIEVFTNKESRQVLEYFMDSYIRHFKLYKYVFTSRIVMDVALEFPNEPEEVPTPEPESEKEPIDEALAEAQMPDDELEEIIRTAVTGNFQEMMRRFESQIEDTVRQTKENIDSLQNKEQETKNSDSAATLQKSEMSIQSSEK